MSAFARWRAVADDANDCHLRVDGDVHWASWVAVTTGPSGAGDAHVGWIEVAILRVVNIDAVLVGDDWQSDETQRIGEALRSCRKKENIYENLFFILSWRGENRWHDDNNKLDQLTVAKSTPTNNSSGRADKPIIRVRPRRQCDRSHSSRKRNSPPKYNQTDVVSQGVAIVLWMLTEVTSLDHLSILRSSTKDGVYARHDIDMNDIIQTVSGL